MTRLVQTIEDLDGIKLGDQLIIDPGFPDDPESVTPEQFDALMVQRNEIVAASEEIARRLIAATKQDPQLIADAFTVAELRGFARDAGLSGYSKLKQADLIDMLISAGFAFPGFGG